MCLAYELLKWTVPVRSVRLWQNSYMYGWYFWQNLSPIWWQEGWLYYINGTALHRLRLGSDGRANAAFDFRLCVSGLYFCTNGRQICGSAAMFELLASANLYQSRLNVPHMKALVTRIQNLLLLFKYDHRWLKYLPKLLRRGFSRSFAPRSPELERAALGSWYLDGA